MSSPSPSAPGFAVIARSTLYNVIFYINLVGLIVFGLPTIAFGRRAVLGLARQWGRSSIWLLGKICGVRFEFRGLENIPQGAVIVASKHQSIFETFALPIAFPDFSYVLKRELMWVPLFGWLLKGAEQIAIDRASGKTALNSANERAQALLQDGRALFIFPEGTRRAVGAPPQYKFGVAHIYATSHAPCLPVALNTGIVWPRRSFWRRKGLCVIQFLPVIPPGLDKETFSVRLQDAIETASDALIAEAYRANPELIASQRRNV